MFRTRAIGLLARTMRVQRPFPTRTSASEVVSTLKDRERAEEEFHARKHDEELIKQLRAETEVRKVLFGSSHKCL